ncbi:MAG: CNNM domain-containing protein, partial [Candidatus Hydrogenedentes bacterium]|nr:CNNM domain-containing protein [Candidatus Hydrogenedentota bacterium]
MLFLALSVFVLGVALNGLFAGYETGFYSADRIRIRFLSEEEKNPRATKLLRDLEHPEKMLTMVLIGTNVSLIVGTMALASQIHSAWLTTLIATPIFLLFAEIVPKSVFRRHPNVLSTSLYPVMRGFSILLWPLSWPTLICVRFLRWLTGVGSENTAQVMSTEEDLRNLIDESAARGTIEREEQEMMHSVMDLQKTVAKEIMVPRIDIQAVPVDTTRAELLELFKESGRTRIPIYRESIDEIIGVANAHDFLLDTEPDN